MIIVISGEDTFRSREFLRSTIENFKRKRDPSGMNVHRFDAREDSIHELKRQEGAGGLFGEKRLFIIEHSVEMKNHPHEIDAFISDRNTDSGNVLCFFIEGKLPDSGVGKELKRAAYQYPFSKLSQGELSRWIKDRLALYQSSIEPKAFDAFVSLCGNDLWVVDSEIAKLSAFAHGRVITAQDLELLSSVSREASSFELVDALFARDQSRTARGIVATSESDYTSVLSLIAGQFRTLGWLKEYLRKNIAGTGAAETVGAHPFVVKKLMPFHSRMTFQEVEAVLTRLRWADGTFKSAPVDGGAVFACSLGSIR